MRMRYVHGLILWGLLAWVSVGWARGQDAPVGVYLEDSPTVRELVGEAGRLCDQQRLAKAVGVYQQIIEQYPRKLMAVEPGLHTDAKRWVYRHLLADAELLAAYRRVYDGDAHRELAMACTPRPRISALERVLARYGLCDAGLEAGLKLAALHLENANVQDAAMVLRGLEGHPDLPRYAPWWHRLGAAVAVLSDDQGQRYQEHIQSLRDLEDHQALAEIEGLAGHLSRPVEEESFDSFKTLPAVPVPDPLGVPLWEKTLSTAPNNQSAVRQIRGIRIRLGGQFAVARQKRAGSASYYPVAPVARGDRLYLCDMKSIFTLDGSSGREVWSYQSQGPTDSNGRARGLLLAASRGAFGMVDQRAVLVRDGYVAGVLGVPSHVRLRRRRGLGGTSLVCLDRLDGQKRWEVRADDLDPALANSEFFGTPIGGRSFIIATVRRSQRAGFQDSYLVAVDPQTGSLVWRRHLFSVAVGGKMFQGLVRVTLTDGRLYVADNLGNVACIESRDGSVVWLTVLGDVPLMAMSQHTPTSGRVNRPETSGPVLVEAGLVVAVWGGFNRVVLLDPQTGRMLRELEDVSLVAGSYLAPAGKDVLLVSMQTRLLDGQDLRPKWTTPLGVTSHQVPQGLPAVTQDRLLLTTREQLLILDLADGRILKRHDIDEPGNVLALRDQVVVAGIGTVRGYLAWDRAYEHLSGRMAQAGDDPEPALALAHVALAAGRFDAVLEAVDHAIGCLARRGSDVVLGSSGQGRTDDPVQRRVFEQLLALINPEYSLSESLRGHLFDRLAKVTAGPADEVAYHLAVGAFLESADEPRRAIDHYQAILSVPNLSSRMCRYEKGWRGAGLEAQSRLGRLIEVLGSRGYERYETEAAQMLVELAAFEAPSAAGLLEIARRYPFSRTAVTAMVQGAQALARQGDPLAALGQLRRAYRRATDVVLIQRIVGLMAQLYEQTDQPGLAVRWLKRVKRSYPQLWPLHGGVPIPIDVLLARLTRRLAAAQRLPSFILPMGQPVIMAGRLLSPTHPGRGAWAQGVTVTISGGTIRLHDGLDMTQRWQSPASDADVELLAVTQEQVLLWYPKQALLSALDTATGRPLWPAVKMMAHFFEMTPDPLAQGLFVDLEPGHGGRFNPQAKKRAIGSFVKTMKIAVNPTAVCLVSRTGLAVGIDRRTGGILWKMIGPLGSVDQLAMDDEVVVLAGQGGQEDENANMIVVLDAMTGQTVIPTFTEKQKIQWLGLSDDGFLLYATTGQVVAYDLNTGQPAWGIAQEGMTWVGGGWLARGMLLLEHSQSSSGALLAIDVATGRIINRVVHLWPRARGLAKGRGQDHRDQHVRYAAGRWYVRTRSQATVLGADGQVRWRDAIFDHSGKNLVGQWVGDQYVLLLDQEGKKDGMWMYTLYLLDRASGVIERQRALGPFPEPIDTRNAVLQDHRLMMPTGVNTIVIHDGQVSR